MTTHIHSFQTVADALRESVYFSTLSDNEIDELAEITHKAHFSEGELVFRQGDPAQFFYIVITGQVQVYKISAEGKEVILHLFGPNDIFAEHPVFGATKTYPAFSQCLKPTELLAIDGEGFKMLAAKRPEMLLTILMRFAQRLREFSTLVEDLALRNVESRLAKYLLSLSENTPQFATIQIHKKTLAAILGTIPETLSRSFKKLIELETIEVHNQEIRILSRSKLSQLANTDDESPSS